MAGRRDEHVIYVPLPHMPALPEGPSTDEQTELLTRHAHAWESRCLKWLYSGSPLPCYLSKKHVWSILSLAKSGGNVSSLVFALGGSKRSHYDEDTSCRPPKAAKQHTNEMCNNQQTQHHPEIGVRVEVDPKNNNKLPQQQPLLVVAPTYQKTIPGVQQQTTLVRYGVRVKPRRETLEAQVRTEAKSARAAYLAARVTNTDAPTVLAELAQVVATCWPVPVALIKWLAPFLKRQTTIGMAKPLLLLSMPDNMRDATLLAWVHRILDHRVTPVLVDASNVSGALPHRLRDLWSKRNILAGDCPYLPIVINLTDPQRLANLAEMLDRRTPDTDFYPTVLVADSLYGDEVPVELARLRRHRAVCVVYEDQLPDIVRSEVTRVLGQYFDMESAQAALRCAGDVVGAAWRALEFEAVGRGTVVGGAAATMDFDPTRHDTSMVARLLLHGVESPARLALVLGSPHTPVATIQAANVAVLLHNVLGGIATIRVVQRPATWRLVIPTTSCVAVNNKHSRRSTVAAAAATYSLTPRPDEHVGPDMMAYDFPPTACETEVQAAATAMGHALVDMAAALRVMRTPMVPLLVADAPNLTPAIHQQVITIARQHGFVPQGPPTPLPYAATRVAAGGTRGATMLWLTAPALVMHLRSMPGVRAARITRTHFQPQAKALAAIRRAQAAGATAVPLLAKQVTANALADVAALDALASTADCMAEADVLDMARFTLNVDDLDRYATALRARAPHAVAFRHLNVPMRVGDDTSVAGNNAKSYAALGNSSGLAMTCQRDFIFHLQTTQKRLRQRTGLLDAVPLARTEARAAGVSMGSVVTLLDTHGLGAYGLVPQPASAVQPTQLRGWMALRIDDDADVQAWFAVALVAHPLPGPFLHAATAGTRLDSGYRTKLDLYATGPEVTCWLLNELNLTDQNRYDATAILTEPVWRIAMTAFALLVQQEHTKPAGLGCPSLVRSRVCRWLTRPQPPLSFLPTLPHTKKMQLAQAVDLVWEVRHQCYRPSSYAPPLQPDAMLPPPCRGQTLLDFRSLDAPGAVAF
jgi:hypothetical protein